MWEEFVFYCNTGTDRLGCLAEYGYRGVEFNAHIVVQVLVVGHDWGSIIGWYLCQLRPDRVKGYVAVAVPIIPRGPGEASWEQQWRSAVGDGFYVCRFQVSMNSNAHRLLFVTLSPGSNIIWKRHPIDMSNDLIVPCIEFLVNFQCLTSVKLTERQALCGLSELPANLKIIKPFRSEDWLLMSRELVTCIPNCMNTVIVYIELWS